MNRGGFNEPRPSRYTRINDVPELNRGRWFDEQTQARVNELAWQLDGERLAEEIGLVLRKAAPGPRRPRRGDPGE